MAIQFTANTQHLWHAGTYFAANSNFSVACRFRLDTNASGTGDRETLFALDNTSSDGTTPLTTAAGAMLWVFQETDNTLHVRQIIGGSTEYNDASAALSTGVDYTLVIRRTATNSYEGYLNGSAVFASAVSIAATAFTRLVIGSSIGSQYWRGRISDFAIDDAAISTTDRDNYVTTAAASLSAGWLQRYGFVTAGDTSDGTANARNLTTVGSPSTQTDPVIPGGAAAPYIPIDLMHRPNWQSLMAR